MNFKLLFLSLICTACATIHPGKKAKVVNGTPPSIVVSADKSSDLSDDHYDFVTITVESEANDIVRINSTEIDFEEPSKSSSSVLVGKDLVSWATAMEEQQKKEEHNRKLAQL